MHMSDSSEQRSSRRGWLIAVAIVVVLLVAGGITGAVLANRATTPGDPHSSGAPTGAAPSAPPTPSVFPTPSAGATAPIEKTAEPIEVKPGQTAEPTPEAFVDLSSLDAVTAGRDIPGEKSGPAVKVAVRLVNHSSKSLDTAGAAVNLTYNGDDRTPAVVLSDDSAVMWPRTLAPGKEATAVYFFAVPLAVTGDVRVIVDLLPSGPDVVFSGPRP